MIRTAGRWTSAASWSDRRLQDHQRRWYVVGLKGTGSKTLEIARTSSSPAPVPSQQMAMNDLGGPERPTPRPCTRCLGAQMHPTTISPRSSVWRTTPTTPILLIRASRRQSAPRSPARRAKDDLFARSRVSPRRPATSMRPGVSLGGQPAEEYAAARRAGGSR